MSLDSGLLVTFKDSRVHFVDLEGLPGIREILTSLDVKLVFKTLKLLLVLCLEKGRNAAPFLLMFLENLSPLVEVFLRFTERDSLFDIATLYVHVDLAYTEATLFLASMGQ